MLPNPGAVVYGTITVGALLAAESATRGSHAGTVGAVVVAMLVYWLAHAYSEFVEQRLEKNQPLTVNGFVRVAAHELMIVAGAAIPLLALLICWAVGVRLTSAVSTAIWTSAAMIVVVEMVAGLRAKLSARALAAQTAAGALFGFLLIALKAIL